MSIFAFCSRVFWWYGNWLFIEEFLLTNSLIGAFGEVSKNA